MENNFQAILAKSRAAYIAEQVAKAGANPLEIDLVELITQKFNTSTRGHWKKGASSHETVAVPDSGINYQIATWRHGDDADFAETMHRLVPYIIGEINELRKSNQEKDAKIAQLQNPTNTAD